MTLNLVARANAGTVPVTPISTDGLKAWMDKAPKKVAAWAEATGFKAKPGELRLIPDDSGGIARVMIGVDDQTKTGLWDYAGLPAALPGGRYAIDADLETADATRAALGWALAQYRFDRYTKMPAPEAELVWPKNADRGEVERIALAPP